MQYLELRFYKREELISYFNLIGKVTKQMLITRLKNLGFPEDGYEYHKNGILIKWKPQTREECIRYIISLLGFDKQVDSEAVATHIYLLLKSNSNEESDVYKRMPFYKRVDFLKKNYNISVSEQTLRKWTANLEKNNIIAYDKGGAFTIHVSAVEWVGDTKTITRYTIEEDSKEYQDYLVYRDWALEKGDYDWDFAAAACWKQFHKRYIKYYGYVTNVLYKDIIDELIKFYWKPKTKKYSIKL